MKVKIELTTESDDVFVTFKAADVENTIKMTKAELIEYIKGK